MQVNDRVIVIIQARPYDRERKSIGKIIGQTKTGWRVEYGDNLGRPKTLFNKKSLKIRGADSLCFTRIEPWNDEEWREYSSEVCRRTAANNLKHTDWSEFDKETLHQIYSIINKARRKARETVKE